MSNQKLSEEEAKQFCRDITDIHLLNDEANLDSETLLKTVCIYNHVFRHNLAVREENHDDKLLEEYDAPVHRSQ